jgi:rRNA pseudouridine-1189 N-methylase Emg1 (Nep1/Mra1 family)
MKKFLFIPFLFLIFEVSAQKLVSKQSPLTDFTIEETNVIVLPPMPLREILNEELIILSQKKGKVVQPSDIEETTAKTVQLTSTLIPVSSEEIEQLSKQKKKVIIETENEKVNQPAYIELKAKLIPIE